MSDTIIKMGHDLPPTENNIKLGRRACFVAPHDVHMFGEILKINKKSVLVRDDKFCSEQKYLVSKGMIYNIVAFE
jgi:hypothetical protein